MSEFGPRWMTVATPLVTARVGQLAQKGISTCLVLNFISERGGIHHLSGTIDSWELPGDGPFLCPIDAQAKLGLIKDMAKSRNFIENKPGFYLRMYKDAKTGLMLINVADFDLLNDQALTPQLLRASKLVKTTPQKTRFRSVNNYKEFTYR